MPVIQSMKIDTTNTKTKLCELGAFLGNDKSPYAIDGHRHAYTGIYTLFFARFVENPVVIAELGIDSCSSMAMWYNYFKHPDTKIFGFDVTLNHINYLNSLEGENIKGLFMDVTKEDSIINGFSQIGGKIDILIDDYMEQKNNEDDIDADAYDMSYMNEDFFNGNTDGADAPEDEYGDTSYY